MSKPEQTVGVIGAGNLGARLAVQLSAVHEIVHVFDPFVDQIPDAARGVNEELLAVNTSGDIVLKETMADVFANAKIIHWCAPLSEVVSVERLEPEQTLVFHASVMAQSVEAQRSLAQKPDVTGKIAIAHLLMNSHRTAVVSTDSDDVNAIGQHLSAAGLRPVIRRTHEHDRIMAVSQAPMAILHGLLGAELASLGVEGMLTPSGEDLAAALEARAAKWTPTTLESILRNPQIPNLIQQMSRMVNEAQADHSGDTDAE